MAADRRRTKKADVQPAEGQGWPASETELRDLDTLIPYARNARTHSEEQVGQIAASIKEWGWTNPILIDEDSNIIAGHGRRLAALKLGINRVPVVVARGWTEAQRRAYVLADNQLALNAGWDLEVLKIELDEITALNFDINPIGFDDEFLMSLEEGEDDGDSDHYTRKIETPIYEPKGDKPPVSALCNDSKTLELVEQINDADLPPDVAAFLIKAASRHTVFDYSAIAEFYAHAPAEIQELMERSALVIIDYDKGIEEGFVKITKTLGVISERDDEIAKEKADA